MAASGSRVLERTEVEALVRQVLRERLRQSSAGGEPVPAAVERSAVSRMAAGGPPHPLVVNVSARHMHVTQEDLEALFGAGARLTKLKELYQEGEFASE